MKFLLFNSIPTGITFKKNCLSTVALAKENPDIRNTKAIDIYQMKSLWELFHRVNRELREYDMEVDVYDPCLPRKEERMARGLPR